MICKLCTKSYWSPSKHSKYCSQTCSTIVRNRQQKVRRNIVNKQIRIERFWWKWFWEIKHGKIILKPELENVFIMMVYRIGFLKDKTTERYSSNKWNKRYFI